VAHSQAHALALASSLNWLLRTIMPLRIATKQSTPSEATTLSPSPLRKKVESHEEKMSASGNIAEIAKRVVSPAHWQFIMSL